MVCFAAAPGAADSRQPTPRACGQRRRSGPSLRQRQRAACVFPFTADEEPPRVDGPLSLSSWTGSSFGALESSPAPSPRLWFGENAVRAVAFRDGIADGL
jgi:hypothetical protein